MSETPMTPAEAAKRLDQYGTEATFRVATYGSGNERALHEIGLTLRTEVDRLRARIEELTSQRDDLLVEDALAEQQRDETFVPRTERSYWVTIADALNAAHGAGMPVGIDLDGTLTDRETWSVVWDRDAERWAVAGYDEDAERDDAGKDTPAGGEFTRTPAAVDRETDVEPPAGWVPTCDTGRRTGRLCDAHDGDLIHRIRGERP